jgi:Spy/CpxP family protein refolding chaperone
MKKTIFALLVLAASAFAQGPGKPPGPPNPTDMVAHLTALLSLTTAQQAQATTIFTNEQTAVQAIDTELQTAHTSLAAAVKSNTTATIDSLSAQIGVYHGQILSTQSKAQAAFYAILTADQQTKYSAIHGGPGGGRGALRGVRPPQ